MLRENTRKNFLALHITLQLNRDFTSNIPLQKLATDITYVPTTDGFIYLSAVQDLFNNEIVSYHISSKNDLELVFATLNKLPSVSGAILHSDQGFQYTNKRYQEALKEKNIQGSHSRKGNCLDNARMESFFSHLKTEAFYTKKLYSSAEAQTLLEQQIVYYNTERFQIKTRPAFPNSVSGKAGRLESMPLGLF